MTDADRPELAGEVVDAYRARREALLRAVTELNADLDGLEAEEAPDPERFRAALRRVRATLHEHIEEAEAPDSLLAQIVEQAPWLTHRTEQLRGEHDDLLEHAGRLIERAEAAEVVAPLLPDARALSEHVSDHRHRGTELLTDAYMLDVGAND